jgi:hypothetical protein
MNWLRATYTYVYTYKSHEIRLLYILKRNKHQPNIYVKNGVYLYMLNYKYKSNSL